MGHYEVSCNFTNELHSYMIKTVMGLIRVDSRMCVLLSVLLSYMICITLEEILSMRLW